jgi:hypothetical protein
MEKSGLDLIAQLNNRKINGGESKTKIKLKESNTKSSD